MLVTDRFPAIAAMSCMADLKTEKSLPLENLSERPVDAPSQNQTETPVLNLDPYDMVFFTTYYRLLVHPST